MIRLVMMMIAVAGGECLAAFMMLAAVMTVDEIASALVAAVTDVLMVVVVSILLGLSVLIFCALMPNVPSASGRGRRSRCIRRKCLFCLQRHPPMRQGDLEFPVAARCRLKFFVRF